MLTTQNLIKQNNNSFKNLSYFRMLYMAQEECLDCTGFIEM